MSLPLATAKAACWAGAIINMVKKLQTRFCTTFYFLPLIVMGGRLAVRVVLNLWNMIEQ